MGLIDREVGGDDTDFDGAADTRKCTDPLCGCAFVIYVVAMVYAVFYGHQNGNVQKLIGGIDWQGQVCGYSKEVADQPSLFWCQIGTATSVALSDPICVKECPTSATTTHKCPGPAHMSAVKTSPDGNSSMSIWRQQKDQNDYETQWMLGYCLPTGASQEAVATLTLIFNNSRMSGTAHNVAFGVQSLHEHKWFIFGMGVLAIILGYAYLATMSFFIGPLLYGGAALCFITLLSGTGYFLYIGHAGGNANFLEQWMKAHDASITAYTTGGVFGVLSIAFAVAMVFATSAFETTKESVQQTSQLMQNQPTLLLQPAAQAVLQVIVMMFLGTGLAFVLSMGDVDTGDAAGNMASISQISGVQRSLSFTESEWWIILFYVFGVLWVLEVVNAGGQYVISYVAVVNQIGQNQIFLPLTKGTFNFIVYHLGTGAFGGFVVAFLKFVQIICEFIMSQTKDAKGEQNETVKAACCCVTCCLACVTKVVELMNCLVYVDCAINGTDYPAASKNVIQLTLTNPITVSMVKFSTLAVRNVGLFVVCGFTTFIAYLSLANTGYQSAAEQGNYLPKLTGFENMSILGPTIAVFMLSSFIAMAFMSIFQQSAEALMYCILWQINQGHKTEDALPASWKDTSAREWDIDDDAEGYKVM